MATVSETYAADAEVVINGHTTMDAELLAAAPRLRSQRPINARS